MKDSMRALMTLVITSTVLVGCGAQSPLSPQAQESRVQPGGLGTLASDGVGVVSVSIDIKPGSDPNAINCGNEHGIIAVAILSTDTFDATTVDHTTVTFEGASEAHVNKRTGVPRRHEEDVDGDGDIDLVLHFRYSDTNLDCASTEGTLSGSTFDGVPFEGTDSVLSISGSSLSKVNL